MRTQELLLLKFFCLRPTITAISWPPPGFHNFFTLAILCSYGCQTGPHLFLQFEGLFLSSSSMNQCMIDCITNRFTHQIINCMLFDCNAITNILYQCTCTGMHDYIQFLLVPVFDKPHSHIFNSVRVVLQFLSKASVNTFIPSSPNGLLLMIRPFSVTFFINIW